jgi:hypothetical protein
MEQFKMCARNFEIIFLTLMKHAAFTVSIESIGHIIEAVPVSKSPYRIGENCVNLYYDKKRGIISTGSFGKVNHQAYYAVTAMNALVNYVLTTGDFTACVNQFYNNGYFRDRGFRGKLENFLKKLHPEFYTGQNNARLLGLDENTATHPQNSDAKEISKQQNPNPAPRKKPSKKAKKSSAKGRKETDEKKSIKPATKPKANSRLSLKQWPIISEEIESNSSESEHEDNANNEPEFNEKVGGDPSADAPKLIPAKQEDPDLNECCICFDNQRDCVFIPCFHLSTCLECGQALKECPICRTNIVKVQQIFKS